jgi:hypothetical protein
VCAAIVGIEQSILRRGRADRSNTAAPRDQLRCEKNRWYTTTPIMWWAWAPGVGCVKVVDGCGGANCIAGSVAEGSMPRTIWRTFAAARSSLMTPRASQRHVPWLCNSRPDCKWILELRSRAQAKRVAARFLIRRRDDFSRRGHYLSNQEHVRPSCACRA